MDNVGDDFVPGIPFIKPPLGKLHLKPPVRLGKLPAGNFNASNFGFACLQPVQYFSLQCHS